MSYAGRPAYFTARQAAWVLNVEQSTISRAIRVGTVRVARRNGRLLIPGSELARLLGDPVDNGSAQNGGRQ